MADDDTQADNFNINKELEKIEVEREANLIQFEYELKRNLLHPGS